MNPILIIDPGISSQRFDTVEFVAKQRPQAAACYWSPVKNPEQADELLHMSFDGAMILGSHASVNNADPWREALDRVVLDLAERKTPILAICYGHQLIGKLFGGTVGPAASDGRYFSGTREVCFLDSPQGFASPYRGRSVPFVISHGEAVTQWSDAFELVATSSDIRCEALRHRTLPIFTMQSHPEALTSFLEEENIAPAIASAAVSAGTELIKRWLEALA